MRSLRRTAAAVAVVVAGLVVAPAPAWAREDPPDVTGLPVLDATAKLAAWNKAVFFQYEPAPDIDLGVDPTDVLVARTEWPQGTPSAVSARPVVRLHLGRRVPDLAGLAEDRARAEAARFAFRLRAAPAGVGPDWIVSVQSPVAGTIVEFVNGTRVLNVGLTAPVAPTPTVEPTPNPGPEPPPGLSTVELAVLAGSGLVTALVLLLGGLAMRRALRRSPERPDMSPAERIEVRAHPGETTGPVLVVAHPDLSVRLSGRGVEAGQ
jgi:hypothetical protein